MDNEKRDPLSILGVAFFFLKTKPPVVLIVVIDYPLSVIHYPLILPIMFGALFFFIFNPKKP